MATALPHASARRFARRAFSSNESARTLAAKGRSSANMARAKA